MEFMDFSNVTITGGLWKQKQDINKQYTVEAVYDRFSETHRFDALKCDWKEKGEYTGHVYWDSDVAKWIEGVSYILAQERNADLEKRIDEAVARVVENADEQGYFNSYYLVTNQEERFCNRDDHELYCLGHFIEAAVAYDKATGKDALLKAMCRYADYVARVFMEEGSAGFVTPGHPEIELALVKLYLHTKQQRYLDLAKFFVDKRGNNTVECTEAVYPEAYLAIQRQDDQPVRDRETIDGHSVRAMYLLAGAADVAALCKDEALAAACRRCYDNGVNQRMYITGGFGSTAYGEAFTKNYHLPNRTAYAETCAAIAHVFFARRMQKLEVDSTFADTIERALYNGMLSGVSMDGRSFFYENPLEIDPEFNSVYISMKDNARYPATQRSEIFECSCCPSNIVRFLPSIGGLLYSYDEDTLYVDQYMDSVTESGDIRIRQSTSYPANGTIRIACKCSKRYIALRIPGWCSSFTLNHKYEMRNGYAVVENTADMELMLQLDMPVQRVAANRRVHENAGKVAVMRGPVVYCAEGVDNGKDVCTVVLPGDAVFTFGETDFILPSLKATAYMPKADDRLYYAAQGDYEEFELKLIPYYAFANRGVSEMVVWFNRSL